MIGEIRGITLNLASNHAKLTCRGLAPHDASLEKRSKVHDHEDHPESKESAHNRYWDFLGRERII
jgi:hypothetical protein